MSQNKYIDGKVCPYCNQKTICTDSIEVYGRSYGMIYLCRSCNAWVGVHKGTDQALGRLANAELRKAKKEAHFYFDKLWTAKIKQGTKKSIARDKAYTWLSGKLGIERQDTHVGWFDVNMCRKVANICKPHVTALGL